MNKITDELLRIVSGFKGTFQGAFNIREMASVPAGSPQGILKLSRNRTRLGLPSILRPEQPEKPSIFPPVSRGEESTT